MFDETTIAAEFIRESDIYGRDERPTVHIIFVRRLWSSTGVAR